jgi:hypothetical protein
LSRNVESYAACDGKNQFHLCDPFQRYGTRAAFLLIRSISNFSLNVGSGDIVPYAFRMSSSVAL